MQNKIILILIMVVNSFGYSQTNIDAKKVNKTLTIQANIMANSMLKKDYSTYVKYLHTDLVKMFGGTTKTIEGTKKSIANMAKDNIELKNITFGLPSGIITFNNQLQCVLPQTIEMSSPNGVALSHTNLIAVSKDNGKNWTFIDSGGKSLDILLKSFPSLSKELKIPEKKQPEMKK